jgi:RND family efflux transporter MFP subunit
MNTKVILISVGILGVVVLGGLKLSSNQKAAKAKLFINNPDREIFVEISQPENRVFENELSFLGVFDPNRENMVSAEAGGRVIRVAVEIGDYVTAGQLIAKVDDEIASLQLQGAEINLEGQKNDDARNMNLIAKEAITQVQVEKTKLGVRSTEVQIKQLKKQIRSTSILAPFSGVVTKRMFDLGSVLAPGSPLLELVDISSLKLTISVPERDVLKFKDGQEVTVTADIYSGKKFKGKVSSIAVKGDDAHNFKVQILVPNSKENRIMAGMYGSVIFENHGARNLLAIPRKALIGSMKKPEVYVVRNGKAVVTSLSIGTSDANYIEVVSGLSKGDQIVVNGQINLLNGSPVRF